MNLRPVRKMPMAATRTKLPIGGTLILILLQREFAWPGWMVGALWALWGIIVAASLVSIWRETDDNKVVISDEQWREVFK